MLPPLRVLPRLLPLLPRLRWCARNPSRAASAPRRKSRTVSAAPSRPLQAVRFPRSVVWQSLALDVSSGLYMSARYTGGTGRVARGPRTRSDTH
eukprot:3364480-Prymnesium_polylepis.1